MMENVRLAALPELLTVLIGPAGAGKSSWCAASGLPSTAIVCLDQLRADVADDECNQDATADAVEAMVLRLAARLRRRLPTVVDATNADARDRQVLLALAAEHQAAVHAVVFNVPLQLVLERNDARPGPLPGRRWGRRVPPNTVAAQHAETSRLAADPGILIGEGFTTVEIIQTFGPVMTNLTVQHEILDFLRSVAASTAGHAQWPGAAVDERQRHDITTIGAHAGLTVTWEHQGEAPLPGSVRAQEIWAVYVTDDQNRRNRQYSQPQPFLRQRWELGL